MEVVEWEHLGTPWTMSCESTSLTECAVSSGVNALLRLTSVFSLRRVCFLTFSLCKESCFLAFYFGSDFLLQNISSHK